LIDREATSPSGVRCFLVRALVDGVFELLAPRRCAGCDERSGCAVFCDRCASLVEEAEDLGAVYEYGGPLADAIQRFKYGGRSDLGSALGALMGVEAQHCVREVDAVVPVPLHWRRRRARGYDQAALLAKPIARFLGLPARLRGLRRVRNTPPQVEFTHQERHQNIAGAFEPWRLGGASRVLLIDDVRTTGATLRAAAAALEAGGVRECHPFVLATRVLGQSA